MGTDKGHGSDKSAGSGARRFGGPGKSFTATLKELGRRLANLVRGKR